MRSRRSRHSGGTRRAAGGAAGALGALWLLACPTPPPPPAPPAPSPAPEAVAPPPPCERAESIEVRKSERTLLVHCVGGARLQVPIALSREPVGAKRDRGDDRTPEGEYHIAGGVRPSRFHLFVPIDYPSIDDADRALREQRISPATHAAIVRAQLRGILPPQDTELGGYLGFHGEGPRWRGDLDLNWTKGCFAMSDEWIERLARLAPSGTPVRILP